MSDNYSAETASAAVDKSAKKSKRETCIIILIIAALIATSIIGTIIETRPNDQLFRALRSHVREHGESTVTLGELMPFQWDFALYFLHPEHRGTIYDAIGVRFERPTDLVAGLIFVFDGEVVYYEIFYRALASSFPVRPRRAPPNFFAPNIRTDEYGRTAHLRIFERDDVFEADRHESTERNWYRLRALEPAYSFIVPENGANRSVVLSEVDEFLFSKLHPQNC